MNNRLLPALATAAVLSLAAFGGAAHAGPTIHAQVVLGAPQPVLVHDSRPVPYYGPRHGGYYREDYRHRDPRWEHRRWEERRWHHDRGYRRGWGDADRDGVPNRYDRRPHNPYRY